MPAVDVHQHLWPEAVLLGLERRAVPPRAHKRRGTAWTIELPGEPAFTVTVDVHGEQGRAAAVAAAGLDSALVALSAPVGIEALRADECAPLLDAWDAASAALPGGLQAWAAVSLQDPDPDRLTASLDAGAVGLCVPAGALASARGLERLGPLLDVLEGRLAPLFVHPGPVAAGETDEPWWPALTDYVAQLNAAWHALAAWGRPAHPRLRILFAALAGLAPLHAERSAARGGPVAAQPDPLVFYDGSSYGARALRAMAGAVGTAQLVYGSDEPVIPAPVETPLGHDAHTAMATSNVARLLGREWSAL